MKSMNLKQIIITNPNQMTTSHNISTLITNEISSVNLTEKMDFKSGLPLGVHLSPQWVTGIIDSEGNFSVLVQTKNEKSKFSLAFKVTQKEHSKGILIDLQKYFDCGNIYFDNKKENAYKFTINKIDDIIEKVIPHLDKYPLLTSKYLYYQDFKKVALLLKEKLHLSKEGDLAFKTAEEIFLLKNNMNSLRSFEERWNYLKSCEPIILNNEWVQGFIDGEGCFQFGIANSVNRGKPYLALSNTLEIAQSNHDILLLNAFIQFFGCGYLKPKYNINDINTAKNSRIVNRFIVNQHAVVTALLDKYPLLTRKYLDYLDWKKLIQLKAERVHNTPEGLQKMKDIKAFMNKGRGE